MQLNVCASPVVSSPQLHQPFDPPSLLLKLHVKRTGRSRTFGRQKVNSAIIRLRNLLWVDELAVLDCILFDIKPRASKLVLTVAK
jgi:hypothetical protein